MKTEVPADIDQQILATLSGQSEQQLRATLDALDRNQDALYDKLWDRCKNDLHFWVFNYAHAVNLHMEAIVDDGDDAPGESIDLFPDFPHVRMVLDALKDPKNLLIDKSRDMMCTWSLCAIFCHDLIFQEAAPLLMASRRFDDVDDGGEDSTTDSLLGRVRFIYENLPEWQKIRAPLRIKTGLMRNKKTDAYIAGIKAVRHTGRGGKYRRAVADEFGHWPYGEANLESMKYACQRGLILLSTPPREGRNHCFGRLATDTTKMMKHLSLHWTLHPLRGDEWYEQAIDGMTPEQIARELEISYSGAVEGRIFGAFDEEVHLVEGLEYDPSLPLYTSHDHGVNEETCVFIQVDKDDTWYIVDEYQGGKNSDSGAITVWDNCEALVNILNAPPYSLIRMPNDGIAGLTGAYGDPAGKVENIILQTRKSDDHKTTSYHSVYNQHNIKIQSKYSKWLDGIQIINDRLKRRKLFISRNKCPSVWEAFIHYRRGRNPKDDPKQPYTDSPVKDWTNHWMDAVRYFGIGRTTLAAARGRQPHKYRQEWRPSGRTGCMYPTMVRVGK